MYHFVNMQRNKLESQDNRFLSHKKLKNLFKILVFVLEYRAKKHSAALPPAGAGGYSCIRSFRA